MCDMTIGIAPEDQSADVTINIAAKNPSFGNGTCTVIANGSCVPTSASNMTGNYTDKGNALGSLGNYTGAILYYDKALAIDPKDVYALDGKEVALNKF